MFLNYRVLGSLRMLCSKSSRSTAGGSAECENAHGAAVAIAPREDELSGTRYLNPKP